MSLATDLTALASAITTANDVAPASRTDSGDWDAIIRQIQAIKNQEAGLDNTESTVATVSIPAAQQPKVGELLGDLAGMMRRKGYRIH